MTTNVYASHGQVMFTIGGMNGVFLTGYNTDDPDLDYIVACIKENSEYGTAKWLGLGQDILAENLYTYFRLLRLLPRRYTNRLLCLCMNTGSARGNIVGTRSLAHVRTPLTEYTLPYLASFPLSALLAPTGGH